MQWNINEKQNKIIISVEKIKKNCKFTKRNNNKEEESVTNPRIKAIFLSTDFIENKARAVKKSACSSNVAIIFCNCSVDTSNWAWEKVEIDRKVEIER